MARAVKRQYLAMMAGDLALFIKGSQDRAKIEKAGLLGRCK